MKKETTKNRSEQTVRWVVLKFGGTSVSSLAQWRRIEAALQACISEGARPFLVCSALSGVSNLLEEVARLAPLGAHAEVLAQVKQQHRLLADELGVDAEAVVGRYFEELDRLALGASLTQEVSAKLHARILAKGELMSTSLGAAFLGGGAQASANNGMSVQWRDAREILLANDEPNTNFARHYLSATCDAEFDPGLANDLSENPADIVITQGFIARDGAGDTVLLGRGGSDTSAAYFAAKLGAQRLEVWTDVPGMFSSNPRDIPSARLLRHLDYDEAQELATMGGKVLHPRCIAPLRAGQIPLDIRCTHRPDIEGTRISGDAPNFGPQVKAISQKTGVTLISMDTLGMWQQVGFLADTFAVFKKHGLSIDLVATSQANVTVSLDPMANALDPKSLQALMADLNQVCQARLIGPCAVVSLVGRNIRAILDELGPAFEVFDEQYIYLLSQAASDLNLTVVVDEDQADRLVQNLHTHLFNKRVSDRLFGPTWTELFGQGIDPSRREIAWWRHKKTQILTVAADGPAYIYNADTLQAAANSLQSITAVDRIFYAVKANPNPDILRLFEAAGLGFECVSPGELRHIRELFGDIDPERILFTPNFAPREDYAAGYDLAGFVTLDNLDPLRHWPELFRNKNLIVRIDPGRGRGHHKYVRTAGPQSKFGVDPADLDQLIELLRGLNAQVVGLHIHVGSGIRRPETWAENALFLTGLEERFPALRYLNLGGGLGVPEQAGQPRLDLQALDTLLAQVKAVHPGLELWLEPGRFLVAEAGVLVARVTQTKKKDDIQYIGVETGMNSLIRPALYGAHHDIVNLSRLEEAAQITAEIVGPICETGDVLGHARRLPASHPDDVLLIATAGAYGRAMSSSYNLRPPAREVFFE